MSGHVVVIGGGYAGVMAANRLAAATSGASLRVTMVTPSETFVERIRLHEYAAGSRDRAGVPLSTLLHPAVTLRHETVVGVDAASNRVTVGDGSTVGYDYLVYAVGSGAPVAPAGSFAITGVEAAAELRAHLAGLSDGSEVEIVGGGLTGIETASEIAESYPGLRVRLRTRGRVAESLSARGRRRVLAGLARLGVEVEELASAAGPPPVADSRTVIWCAGFVVPGLAAASGLPVDDAGRVLVDSTLRVVGHERIFGAGDAAKIADPAYDFLRMACATALPMGAQVADNILRLADGGDAEAHAAGYLAQCISLGRRDGLFQFVRSNDTPRHLFFSGATGARVKEYVCAQTLKWLGTEARRSGAYSWPSGPRSSPEPTGVRSTGSTQPAEREPSR